MSNPDDTADEASTRNRRSLLRSAGLGVAGTLFLGAGTASADAGGRDCELETYCSSFECPDGSGGSLFGRYCCDDGDCSDWNYLNECC